jgi:4-amino-4-deoxy-L-arabinose transferase-like glycosyltransferase
VEANNDTKNSALRDFALFLALALAYRIVYLLLMPRVLDSADAIHYIDTAKHFASGDFWGFNAKIPVLYPLLAALVHGIVDDYEWSCLAVSLIASTLLVIPTYALSRDLHGQPVARVMALLVAIWPWLVDYASRVGPDALGCTLWFFSVWMLAAPRSPSSDCISRVPKARCF